MFGPPCKCFLMGRQTRRRGEAGLPPCLPARLLASQPGRTRSSTTGSGQPPFESASKQRRMDACSTAPEICAAPPPGLASSEGSMHADRPPPTSTHSHGDGGSPPGRIPPARAEPATLRVGQWATLAQPTWQFLQLLHFGVHAAAIHNGIQAWAPTAAAAAAAGRAAAAAAQCCQSPRAAAAGTAAAATCGQRLAQHHPMQAGRQLADNAAG